MTLNHIFNACHLLKCVDVLSIIAKEFPARLDASDKLVTRGRLELARINFTGKFKKWTGIFFEVVNAKKLPT